MDSATWCAGEQLPLVCAHAGFCGTHAALGAGQVVHFQGALGLHGPSTLSDACMLHPVFVMADQGPAPSHQAVAVAISVHAGFIQLGHAPAEVKLSQPG